MEKLIIEGGNRLYGELAVHGSKNSALPILAATLLGNTESIIHNCPQLSDVDASLKILEYLGCHVKREGNTVIVDPSTVNKSDIPDQLMREMRSSIVFLGAIASKMGKAKMSFPGGCELGPRPIDLHLSSLRQLGMDIQEQHGYLDCTVNEKLRGTAISLRFPSVGATENTMLAAIFAHGTTEINNAAHEPEIVDLADYLNSRGAKIKGAGSSTIIIQGVKELYSTEYTVIPDRIAAVTYLSAAATAGGKILVKSVIPQHLRSVIPLFEEAGCLVKQWDNNKIYLISNDRLKSIGTVRTMPYPGFPTDAQAPIMAMTTVAKGTSIFVENIFENRYKHAGELLRYGAKIKIEGRVAIVEGVEMLTGATTSATDLRGGASLVIAALAAMGRSEIIDLHHIDRGYESIEKQLAKLGCKIQREIYNENWQTNQNT